MGIASLMCLGNPAPCLLTNNEKLIGNLKEMVKDAVEQYFKRWNGCDYDISSDEIKIGIEPAYMYENLKIISINKEIGFSYIRTGYAFGGYGSGIRSRIKYYKEYKNNSKFKKFIDKWHKLIFKNNN